MRAWLLTGFTGIESMRVGSFAEPSAGPGEVVVELQYAALNPADRSLSIGQYPAKPVFPHILGRDGVGTVVSVGEGVTGIKVGDTRLILRSEVGVSKPGTLAERVAVAAGYTTNVPRGWSLEQAAAAPLVYLTAWQALKQWGDLPEENGAPVVLVTGASGGVGVAAVQLAYSLGYRVVALSRSAEKREKLKEMGAEIVMDHTDKNWRKKLKEQLGTRRVDLAVESLGGVFFSEVIDVMGMWGKISAVGRVTGPVPEFNTATLFFRRLRVGGVALSSYTNEEMVAAWGGVKKAMGKTGAKPVVDRVFGFDEVLAAFARLTAGPMGKVVVKIGS